MSLVSALGCQRFGVWVSPVESEELARVEGASTAGRGLRRAAGVEAELVAEEGRGVVIDPYSVGLCVLDDGDVDAGSAGELAAGEAELEAPAAQRGSVMPSAAQRRVA